MRCRFFPLSMVVVLGCAVGCRKDDDAVPIAAEPGPAVTSAPVESPPHAPQLPEQQPEEDEPAPRGPAVEVRVAEDPAQPLAWYRGFTTDRGQQGAVLYSRKASARGTLAILDGGVALRGHDKPTGVRKGPPRLVGDRPLLVSIGAQWCRPCSEELGDVVDLARKVRGDATDAAAGLLFSLQGVPDEWPLAEVRDEFVAKHKVAKKLKQAIEIPPWVEFRADIESNWGEAVGKLGLLGGDSVSLPVNLLLDRCGHVQAAASGALNDDKRLAFLKQAAKLAAVGCRPAPALPPVQARPAVPGPVKPRVDPKPGEGKTAPPSGVEAVPKAEPGLNVPSEDIKAPGERPAPVDKPAPAPAPKPEPAASVQAGTDKPAGDKTGAAKPEKSADKPKDEGPADKAAPVPPTGKPKDDKPAAKKADAPTVKEATK